MYVLRHNNEDGSDTVTLGVPPTDVHLAALVCEAMNMIEAIAAQEEHSTTLGVWRHVRRGGQYIVIAQAVREHDLEPMTIYKSVEDGRVWVRPSSEFMDGRFEQIGVASNGV